MSLGLTVITHTCETWGRDINPCLKSVELALPPNAKHTVIGLEDDQDEFLKARFDALNLDDVIVFVDDDDTISVDSLFLCLSALENSGAGVAFTNEVRVFPSGSEIRHYKAGCTYEMICQTQGIIHHIAAIRTNAVSNRAFDLVNRVGVDAEWAIKTDAALGHGAIHVPIFGYFWNQHEGQHHKLNTVSQKQFQARDSMTKEMQGWIAKHRGVMPIY